MKDKDRIILRKIDLNIQKALHYVKNLDFDGFKQDAKTIDATAFVIGQIGELVTNVSAETKEANPQIKWIGIKGMRNRIVHDYENIDLSILWGTVTQGLPSLSKDLNEILSNEVCSTLNSKDADTR